MYIAMTYFARIFIVCFLASGVIFIVYFLAFDVLI